MRVRLTDERGAMALTDRAHLVVALAHRTAVFRAHGPVGAEHLLLAMTEIEESVAALVLASLGISLPTLRAEVERRLPANGSHVDLGDAAGWVLQRAQAWADDEWVGTEHLLTALGEVGGTAGEVLAVLGATPDRVTAEAARLLSAYPHGRPEPGVEPTAEQLVGARRLVVPPGLPDYEAAIAEARREKEAAVDDQRFDSAARLRDTERQLLAERQRLVHDWLAEVDPVVLVTELDRLYRQADHLLRP
ncbi:Clp protease N-terminal domain-containing protein [Dactylosporangium sp. AC04546]|uniref:UvrB/UvrC motif-containing protein n=1 Tax=Dactylosporangium sp. AC04546 TaxID=2862460 RepID=UPI001EE0D061|nr:UvrB/UvrC motif-containing protein [Dactylosporangium sp. AC04546]WVK88606.1 Clp protease N-terminal domain-containing protein [Dactylosporangium sp. AC04546]